MKRSSQTEKKVFSSANDFEKRPAAKKNCADYGFCAAQIFIALTTAVSLLFGKKLGWNLRENMLICIMTSVLLFSPWLAEHVLRVSFPPILILLFMLLIMGAPIYGKLYKFYFIIKYFTFYFCSHSCSRNRLSTITRYSATCCVLLICFTYFSGSVKYFAK